MKTMAETEFSAGYTIQSSDVPLQHPRPCGNASTGGTQDTGRIKA